MGLPSALAILSRVALASSTSRKASSVVSPKSEQASRSGNSARKTLVLLAEEEVDVVVLHSSSPGVRLFRSTMRRAVESEKGWLNLWTPFYFCE